MGHIVRMSSQWWSSPLPCVVFRDVITRLPGRPSSDIKAGKDGKDTTVQDRLTNRSVYFAPESYLPTPHSVYPINLTTSHPALINQ